MRLFNISSSFSHISFVCVYKQIDIYQINVVLEICAWSYLKEWNLRFFFFRCHVKLFCLTAEVFFFLEICRNSKFYGMLWILFPCIAKCCSVFSPRKLYSFLLFHCKNTLRRHLVPVKRGLEMGNHFVSVFVKSKLGKKFPASWENETL